MDDKFFACISDPVNARLLLEIYEQKRVTTANLLEKFTDIPPATLYRRLKKMLCDGALKVVEERPIRGTMEKVYALGYDIDARWKEMGETNDGKAYLQLVTLSLLGILKEFQEYTARADIDLKGDGTGFYVAPVYATYEELTAALNKIGEALDALKNNAPGEGRKFRNICIAITPPKNE